MSAFARPRARVVSAVVSDVLAGAYEGTAREAAVAYTVHGLIAAAVREEQTASRLAWLVDLVCADDESLRVPAQQVVQSEWEKLRSAGLTQQLLQAEAEVTPEMQELVSQVRRKSVESVEDFEWPDSPRSDEWPASPHNAPKTPASRLVDLVCQDDDSLRSPARRVVAKEWEALRAAGVEQQFAALLMAYDDKSEDVQELVTHVRRSSLPRVTAQKPAPAKMAKNKYAHSARVLFRKLGVLPQKKTAAAAA